MESESSDMCGGFRKPLRSKVSLHVSPAAPQAQGKRVLAEKIAAGELFRHAERADKQHRLSALLPRRAPGYSDWPRAAARAFAPPRSWGDNRDRRADDQEQIIGHKPPHQQRQARRALGEQPPVIEQKAALLRAAGAGQGRVAGAEEQQKRDGQQMMPGRARLAEGAVHKQHDRPSAPARSKRKAPAGWQSAGGWRLRRRTLAW